MSSKHHILFDLDGTLTDSFKGIVHSVQYALSRYGIVENDLHKFTPVHWTAIDLFVQRILSFLQRADKRGGKILP